MNHKRIPPGPGNPGEGRVVLLLLLVGGGMVFLVAAMAIGVRFVSFAIDKTGTGAPVQIDEPVQVPITIIHPLEETSNAEIRSGLPQEPAGSPRYSLKPNESEFYTYKYQLIVGQDTIEISGQLDYMATDKDALELLIVKDKDFDSEKLMGNGTGFFIRPDGLMLTCAHVVRGMETINVVFNDQVLLGKVVEVDHDNDLALVRVPVTDVPFLKINRDRPKLGHVARVFGFPLTQSLGESIKLTTGTVSGFDNRPDGARMQLDATANPGNSGGPATNDSGELIGVVDSMISGAEIASVSFAVPSSRVIGFLEKSGVDWVDAANTTAGVVASLDQVADAVAMLKISPDTVMANWVVVQCSGNSKTSIKNPRPQIGINQLVNPQQRMIELMRGRSSDFKDISGELVIDRNGQIIFNPEPSSLGTELVGPNALPFFCLEKCWQESWSEDEVYLMTQTVTQESEGGNGLLGRPSTMFGPSIPFSGRQPERKIEAALIQAKVHREMKVIERNPLSKN